MDAQETLAQIASEVDVCVNCPLHTTRKKSVPGVGPADSEIMLIGEGPGFNENEQGLPFVGQAGQFLNELLGLAGMKREEVWIGNVVKCRPPGNRDPMPEELAACDKFLERQIAAINPKIIITLGRFSMGKFMTGAKISIVHGQMRKIGNRFVIAMFHPAAALHNPTYLPHIKADFAKLPQLLDLARKELAKTAPAVADTKATYPVEEKKDEAKQMKLF
jgi:uracil-DNA glycosylase